MVAAWTLPLFSLIWMLPGARAAAPESLSAAQNQALNAVSAAQPEEAAVFSGRALDGSAPATAVDAGDSGEALKRSWPQPKPGPAYDSPARGDLKKSSWDDAPARPGGTGSWEVTKAGFLMGFNVAEYPAYLLKTSKSMFSFFSYVLFAVLAPAAFVIGLVGIVLAHGSVERWNRDHAQQPQQPS